MRMRIVSREIIFNDIPLDAEYYHCGGGSFQAKQSSILEEVTSVAVFKRDGIL